MKKWTIAISGMLLAAIVVGCENRQPEQPQTFDPNVDGPTNVIGFEAPSDLLDDQVSISRAAEKRRALAPAAAPAAPVAAAPAPTPRPAAPVAPPAEAVTARPVRRGFDEEYIPPQPEGQPANQEQIEQIKAIMTALPVTVEGNEDTILAVLSDDDALMLRPIFAQMAVLSQKMQALERLCRQDLDMPLPDELRMVLAQSSRNPFRPADMSTVTFTTSGGAVTAAVDGESATWVNTTGEWKIQMTPLQRKMMSYGEEILSAGIQTIDALEAGITDKSINAGNFQDKTRTLLESLIGPVVEKMMSEMAGGAGDAGAAPAAAPAGEDALPPAEDTPPPAEGESSGPVRRRGFLGSIDRASERSVDTERQVNQE